MKGKIIKISIVTPEKTVFEGEADYLGIPSADGGLGILPGHIPLICLLDTGIIKIVKEKNIILVAVGKGYLQFLRDNANIITQSAIITSEENKKNDIEKLKQEHNIIQEITEETKKIAMATAALRDLGKY